jgi:hypothetical protein
MQYGELAAGVGHLLGQLDDFDGVLAAVFTSAVGVFATMGSFWNVTHAGSS